MLLRRALLAVASRPCLCAIPQAQLPFRHYATATAPQVVDIPQPRPLTQLHSRSLIRISGADTLPFLQGLITTNIPAAESALVGGPYKPAIYTAFLNAQGRVLQDALLFCVSAEGSWLIEVDTKSRSSLLSHLKKHKLRAKVKLEVVDNLEVYHGAEIADSQDLVYHDPRPGMGVRVLLQSDSSQEARDVEQQKEAEEYKIHRMIHGIAEGQDEIVSGSALPQESNIDFFGGIDFRKGCYLGQELTIRTHHTGVVRKRILPVQLYSDALPGGPQPNFDAGVKLPMPPPGSNMSKVASRGRSTGKWLGGVGNVGLALCRLEMMTDIRLTEESSHFDPHQEFKVSWEAEGEEAAGEVKVKAFVPSWLRSGIATSLKSRERKSEKVEKAEEVD